MERTNRLKLIPTFTLEQWLKEPKTLFQDPYHKDVKYSLVEIREAVKSRSK